MRFLPFAAAFALACTLSACVSSSDYEHLERQDQLHQLETTNLKKRVDALSADLERAKGETAAAEAKLATAMQTIEQREASIADLQAQLAAKQGDYSVLEGKLARVREALNDTSLAKAPARKALLLELLPSQPPKGVAVEGAPAAAAPAPSAEPADVTH
jgi:septal ring factor EnvC (AmiA/AmiB activator)